MATLNQPKAGPPFTWQGFRTGLAGGMILVPGVALYGTAFGMMAQAAGLGVIEAVFMSAWVNAGGAQMATLQAWADPVPLFAVCLTTLAMNARYLLLGAALRPWFSGLPPHRSYASLFVMGDANWALALREFAEGRRDAAFLAGSGALLSLLWISTTCVGHLFGQVLGDPKTFGVDFMLAAFFITMAAAFVRQMRDIAPLLVGVIAAVIVEKLTAGPWYILAGALAGSFAGAVRYKPEDSDRAA